MKISSNSDLKQLDTPFKIDINVAVFAQKTLRFLLAVVACLVCFSILGDIARYFMSDFPMRDFLANKFALHREQSFPTLYSSWALLFCSVILGFISCLKFRVKDRYTLYWQVLSATFLYLSIDELLSLHESLSKPMHKLGVNGFFHNAWVIPGFVVLSVFLLYFYKFFLHLPPSTKYLTVLSTCLAVGGAFGIELINGYYKYLHGEENFGYAALGTLEEIMEMLGIVFFIYALLTYLPQIGIDRIKLGCNVDLKA